MFGGNSVKFSDDLWELIKVAAEIKGCSSPKELVERIVKSEVDKILQSAGKKELSEDDVNDIANKLKGLGYLE